MLAQSKESSFRSASSAQSAVAARMHTAQMSERISDTKRRNLFVTSSHVPIRNNPPDAQSCSVFSVSGLRIKRGRAFSPDITLKPTV